MAIFKAPRIQTSQRSTLVLQKAELVYDLDQNVFYGGNGIQFGGFPIGSGVGGSTVTQIVTLTAQNILDKQIILDKVPVLPETVKLSPNNGIPQINGIDFQVNLNILSWDGLGLDGVFEENDILIIEYRNSTDIIIEAVTITQNEINNKQIILSSTPSAPETVTMFIVGGLPQVYGIDFTVEANVLKWNGLGLEGFLEVNDVLIIQH